MDNKKELLERVLLMMNYDSSKTLNENINLITEQYAWPSILQQGLELSKTRAFSGPKWETYLNGLKATTLPDLMKIQKGFSDAGYGAISPDFGLQGFNKPNPTPASIVLENDIFVKSLRDYENKKAKGLYAGPKPTGPQSTLIPEVPVQMKSLFGKTSGQLLDGLQKQRDIAQQKKKEEQSIKSGCPFKNKSEGDAFRNWFNDSFPQTAKKYELSRSGDFCNSYIKNAVSYKITQGRFAGKTAKDAYVESVKFYEQLKSLQDIKTLPKEFQDLPAWARAEVEKQGLIGFKNSDLQKSFEAGIENRKQIVNQNFDLRGLDVVIKTAKGVPLTKVDIVSASDNTATKYDSKTIKYGWIEPKTKIMVPKYILEQGKDAVIDYLIDEFEEQKKLEEIEKTKKDGLIKQLFTQKEIDYALENCDEESVLAFFEEIINGTKKNNKGQFVGKYYRNSKGQSYMAKWDSPKIPCEDPFWKEYGVYIQLGGMLAIGILTGGLGLSASAALLVELAADTALNLYSLKKSSEAQDPDAIKMDLAYVFLPLLMASAPVKAALKSAKFGDEVIQSVESKLKTLPQNASKTQVDNLLKNMTPQEQRVIKELGKEEYKDVVQKASKDVMDGLQKTAKAPIGRKISNPLINILVYGAPAANYLVKQVNKINDILKSRGKKPLNAQEQEIWAMALSFLNSQDRNEFTNSLNNLSDEDLDSIISNPKIQQAIQKQYYTETIKNEEDRKKSADEFIKDLRKIMEESAKKVEESNDEIELIVLDEPVIE